MANLRFDRGLNMGRLEWPGRIDAHIGIMVKTPKPF